jgi:hypothetical protein
MTKTHPYILIIDATYKINYFRMPLLHVVGLTELGGRFPVGFDFLSSEDNIEYKWAVRQISSMFEPGHRPHVTITNNEKALKAALADKFPDTSSFSMSGMRRASSSHKPALFGRKYSSRKLT